MEKEREGGEGLSFKLVTVGNFAVEGNCRLVGPTSRHIPDGVSSAS